MVTTITNELFAKCKKLYRENTRKELKYVLKIPINFGKSCGDATVIIALYDLIANGDISSEKE